MELFQIPTAYAAEKQKTPQGTGTRVKGQENQDTGTRSQGPAERFEKNLESLRELIKTVEQKSRKGQEPADEINAIKNRKAEIEAIDAELRAEFAVTEKKLKDAKLPGEILKRHQKFTAHYESNLKELIGNLDALSKAEKKSEVDAAVRKAKEHLEKTKGPSRHVPYDPSKLPNRMVKAKPKAPRLTPEDFRRDFPQHKIKSKQKIAASRLLPDLLTSRAQHKPVLLAFNDSVNNVPFSLWTKASTLPSNADMVGSLQIASSPFLLVQAIDQPSAEDLAETPDIQFTVAIRAKAQELGNNPVKIYEYVRNNIEYAPTYGSIQGADQCLQSKICNDMDTASLLISLLRVSGIYSHYEYSTIEIPIEKAMNWVGGVTDPKMAGTILATNGIPAKVLVSGGTIKAVQLEHVYVKTWIDYIPSRGAVHKQGDTWIPLDPSYKQYTYTQGIDMQSAVPFDAQTFANQIQATATINPDGSVTNVNSALVQQTMQDYQTQVQNYIQQNYPNATVGDVIGKKEIKAQILGILPPTLPYNIIQTGSEFATVPDNLRETMNFSIPDQTGSGTGLTYSTSLPQIAGKKITLSFSPATANDQKVIESLLPSPHADGTPIQPSELPASFPAYLINLKAELRIDGQVVATGSSVTMGSAQSFTMSLSEPGIGLSNIDNIIQTGEYFGIGVDTGRIGADRLNTLKAKIEATKTKLEAQNYTDLTKDDVVGDILYTTITSYFAELDAADEIAARTMTVIRYRVPSVGMFSLALNINEMFGIPISAGPKGMMIDVDRIMQSVFSNDGSMDKVKQFMLSSGSNSSALEHAVPEQLFSTPTNQVQGISAVKALSAANDQGIPVYVITAANINTILPLLQLNADVKNDIQNAINAGKIVTAQKTNVTFNGWTGCGYIIIDPNTGAGAYMISDGLNGGGFEYWFWTVMWGLAWIALIAAISILIVAFLPEIIAALSAIGSALVALGGLAAVLYRAASQLYSAVSTQVASFLQSRIVLNALYNTSTFYAQNSPPPWPIPTDLTGSAYYFAVFLFYLYLGIRDYMRTVYLINYWRFAKNVEIMLNGLHDVDIKTMSNQSIPVLNGDPAFCA